MSHISFIFFFFNDTATTEIYTLSLHDALPICECQSCGSCGNLFAFWTHTQGARGTFTLHRVEPLSPGCPSWSRFATCKQRDRKSTRLNSSHLVISYAVFCLKKKNTTNVHTPSA